MELAAWLIALQTAGKETWELIGTVSGAILGIFAIASTVYGYAKALVKINGLGRRVRELEDENKQLQTLGQTFTRALDKSLHDRAELRERVVTAQSTANATRDHTDELHGDLAGRIADWRTERNAEMNDVRERLREVEVRVKLSEERVELLSRLLNNHLTREP